MKHMNQHPMYSKNIKFAALESGFHFKHPKTSRLAEALIQNLVPLEMWSSVWDSLYYQYAFLSKKHLCKVIKWYNVVVFLYGGTGGGACQINSSSNICGVEENSQIENKYEKCP